MRRDGTFLSSAAIVAVGIILILSLFLETDPADGDRAAPTSSLTERPTRDKVPEYAPFGDAPVRVVEMPTQLHEDPAFGSAVRAWLLDNPDILYEMAAKLDAQRAEAATAQETGLIDAHHDALFGDTRDGRLGPEGDNVLPAFVEFVDYNCGFCKRNHADVTAWRDANPGRAVIVKEFPILGPGSEAAARAALAVRNLYGLRAYAAIHNFFLELEGPLDEAAVTALLGELALDDDWDIDAVRAEMRSDAVTAHIGDTRRLAAALGISGTPGFVFRGRIARGLTGLEELEAATVEQAGTGPGDDRGDSQ